MDRRTYLEIEDLNKKIWSLNKSRIDDEEKLDSLSTSSEQNTMDITDLKESSDSISTSVDAINNTLLNIASSLANPNILINGDFSINQRGMSSYSQVGKYTVDRWIIRSGNGTLTPKEESMTSATLLQLQNHDISSKFIVAQYIENSKMLKGATVTMSIKYNDKVYHKTWTNLESQDIYVNDKLEVEDVLEGLIRYSETRGHFVEISVNNGKNVYIEYCKLEFGALATRLIETDVGKELSKCQRYYQNVYGGVGSYRGPYIALILSLTSSMRHHPIVKMLNAGNFIATNFVTAITGVTCLTQADNVSVLAIYCDTYPDYYRAGVTDAIFALEAEL